MNADDYKAERKRRGTQEEVAAALGVSRVAVARRETGTRPVSREAWLALLALPKKRARAKRPNDELKHRRK
jgi:transcriptional regulator with XRE-family HTH domain